jgi:ABC-2 type transport system ATP-binding protein
VDAIVVDGLRKRYGAEEALRGVSFAVAPGEVVAVLGPNGAGKTTLVEILEGFRTRDGGSATVLGMDPAARATALRERVGIVLQESQTDSLYYTARETLRMYAEYYPRPLDPDEVIRLVGLEDKADARVRTLSGGQRRRLDVGLGMVGDPDVLFLDEPTTGFDPGARRHAWSLVENLRSLGKTVLLTTHYLDEAQHLADRVVVIVAGAVVADGPPDVIAGRDRAPVRISFRLSGAGAADLQPPMATRDGGEYSIETTDATSALHELTGWALAAGVRLDGITVERPSLEDVYLELTAS